jgi:hypothetical protein
LIDWSAAVGLDPAARTITSGARLNWTWDELVLACDLLAQNNWHELPDTDERVIELSGLLRSLPIHPVDGRGPSFRGPGSVRRKMADLATAECHHVVPLHVSGATTTKLADLAILCANCHRMIHRGDPWLTPDELRDLVRTVDAAGRPGRRG